jgi:hypothetical protein
MGAFLDIESIEHCIILSQECFEAEDCEASTLFLDCIKLAVSIFPSLGSSKKGFQNLVEFFDASRTTSTSSSMKRDMEKYGVVTMLSDILARCGTVSRPTSAGLKKGGVDDEDFDFEDNKSSHDTLHEQLFLPFGVELGHGHRRGRTLVRWHRSLGHRTNEVWDVQIACPGGGWAAGVLGVRWAAVWQRVAMRFFYDVLAQDP